MSVVPSLSTPDRVMVIVGGLFASSTTGAAVAVLYHSVLSFPDPQYLGLAVIALTLGLFTTYIWYEVICIINIVLEESYSKGWMMGYKKLEEDTDCDKDTV